MTPEEKAIILRMRIAELEDNYYKMVKQDTSIAMDIYRDELQPARSELNVLTTEIFENDMINTITTASPLNKELFSLAWSFEPAYKPATSHYGKVELGQFINALLENYAITRKPDAKD